MKNLLVGDGRVTVLATLLLSFAARRSVLALSCVLVLGWPWPEVIHPADVQKQTPQLTESYKAGMFIYYGARCEGDHSS